MLGGLVAVSFGSIAELVLALFTVNSLARDGETTWFEGLLLLGVYTLLALAFFFSSPMSTTAR